MRGIIRLFILLVLQYINNARATDVVCGDEQYLANPDSCSSYYECSNGVPYLMPCPTGEDYSPTLQICTTPELANCKSGTVDASTIPITNVPVTSSTSSSILPHYYCPQEDGSTSYIYPNPLSCSSFYMCNGGSLQIFQCSQGLEYSVTERVCVYPYIAKCDLNNLPSFPYGPTTQASCQATASPTTAVTAGPTPNYYCPEIDGAHTYIYASPYSCSSYYMCAEGQLYLFQCSAGLDFSVTDRVCAFPALAKCDLNHLPSYPTGPTEASDVSNPTTAAATGPAPSYYCPEVDGSLNYIYPSPYSCSSYYLCSEGKLYLFQCSSGLQYSVTNRICVLPTLAKCDLNNLPSYPTGPTEAPIVSNPTTSAVTRPAPNYYCPEVDGANSYIYASPYSCSSYYMCAGGELYLFQCTLGLEFSATDRICTFPAYAKCDLNNLPSYPTGPTEAIPVSNPTTSAVITGPTPNYYCPEIDGASSYIYPSPYSCSSYYMCSEGKLYLFQCSGGLEFSVTDRVCAFPALAKCDLNNLPSYPTGPTEAATVSNNPTISVVTATDPNPTTSVVTGPVPNYYCPEVDGANTYIYPSPYSCSSYYICAEGKLYLFHCSAGLDFSAIDRVCAFPAIAKCDLNNLPSYPTGPTEAPTVPNPTTSAATGPAPNYYCPEVDGANTYIYPNPYSCSSYYMCGEGKLYLFQCPSGLQYSVKDRVCAFPSTAKCDLNNLPSFPTGPTEAVTVVSPTTSAPTGSVPNYYCPGANTNNTYVYPNPYSCSSYYMCVQGSLYLVPCASGLEYSIEFRVCVAPSLAKCDLSNLPTYPTGDASTLSTVSVDQPTASNPATPIPNYYCPDVDATAQYYYPNPYSCTSYYHCIGGKLHLYQCPDGHEYSLTEKTCDLPEVAKCDLSNLPDFPTGPTVAPTIEAATSTSPTTTTVVVVPSTTAGSDNTITVTYECPPNESGTYYRYPGDCHKFYECNYGVAEVQTCPTGTLFSESKVECLYPSEVPECSTTSSS